MQRPKILLLLQLFMPLRFPGSYCRLHIGSRFVLHPTGSPGEPLRWLRGLATSVICRSAKVGFPERAILLRGHLPRLGAVALLIDFRFYELRQVSQRLLPAEVTRL